VEITSQNHGFAVDDSSLTAAGAVVTHINLNDQTVEGFTVADRALFSVQYHPEASPGPHDATYLFDCFRDMMETGRAPSAEQMHAAQEKLAQAGRKSSPRPAGKPRGSESLRATVKKRPGRRRGGWLDRRRTIVAFLSVRR